MSGQTTVRVIYDEEGCGKKIERFMKEIEAILDLNGVSISQMEALQGWQRNNIETHDTPPIKVVYIASAETEDFHKKVRKSFIQDCKAEFEKPGKNICSFIVLFYPEAGARQTDRAIKFIKDQLKKLLKSETIQADDVKKAMSRIVKVKNIDQISTWLPVTLRETCGQTVERPRGREIGVYFKIDIDDDEQMEWMNEQRTAIERDFTINCKYNDGMNIIPEEDYIQYSFCVVMYVNGKNKSDKKISDDIKNTAELCKKHGTKLQVYMKSVHGAISRTMEKDCGMTLVGTDDMKSYWIGLLGLLNVVRVERRPNPMFQSDYPNEVGVTKFEPDKYPSTFESGQPTSRPQTNMTNREDVRSLKDVPVEILNGISFQLNVGGEPASDNASALTKQCACFPFLKRLTK